MTILGIAVILIGAYQRHRFLVRVGTTFALAGFVLTAGTDIITRHDIGAAIEGVTAGVLVIAAVAFVLRRRRTRKPARS